MDLFADGLGNSSCFRKCKAFQGKYRWMPVLPDVFTNAWSLCLSKKSFAACADSMCPCLRVSCGNILNFPSGIESKRDGPFVLLVRSFNDSPNVS